MTVTEKIALAACIAQLISALSTVFVGICTILITKRVSNNQQKVTILTQKRSDRINSLRLLSSEIISLAKIALLKNFNNTQEEKKKIVFSVSRFCAQLQYIYSKDIELIDLARELEKFVLRDKTMIDNRSLLIVLNTFWLKCDLYIGTEFERLKAEIKGQYSNPGQPTQSQQNFDSIYNELAASSNKYFSKIEHYS